MKILKDKRIKLIYILGIALLLVSLCAGAFAVPYVYAGSPSGARHTAAGDGGGSGDGGGNAGAPAGNPGASTPTEETVTTGDEAGTGDVDGSIAGEDTTDDTVAPGGSGVYTDKADYAPYEIPVITGTGYTPNSVVNVTVVSPDGSETTFTATTDAQGQFVTTFSGSLYEGTFNVTATDGNTTFYTTFTDGVRYYFKYSGLDGDCPGSSVVVVIEKSGTDDSVTKSEIDAGGSSGYYAGEFSYTPSWDWTDTITSSLDGKRYAYDHQGYNSSSGGSKKTYTGYYIVQYRLTVVSPYGSTTPSIGEHWYDAGTQFKNNPSGPGQLLTPYVTPLSVDDGGTTYNFVEWIGDGQSDPSAEGTDYVPPGENRAYSHNFNLNGPRTVEAIWTEAAPTQFYLDVQSLNDYGLYAGSGEGWYNSGDTTYARLNIGLVEAIANDTMYEFNYWSVGAANYGNNYLQSDLITMDGDKTAVANWSTLYYLTVTSAYGKYSGSGEGYYYKDAYAYASLNTGLVEGGGPGDDIRYKFDDWDGAASGSNYALSSSIKMTEPKEAIADWDTQFYLLVNNGGHGSTYGTDWYDDGEKAYFGVDDDTIDTGPGTRFKFDEWVGSGSGSYNGDDSEHYVYMNNPITETATWNTQYYLSVSNGGHGDGTYGQGWYDDGDTAFAKLKEPFEVYQGYHDTRYLYTGWGDDASGDNREYSSGKWYSKSDPIIMTGPMYAVAQWQTQYYLSVNDGGHGDVYGSGWYNKDADATFGVVSTIVPSSDGKRYIFDEWDGSPCGAYNGSDPEYTIKMTKHFVETADWDTQYRLIMYSTITDAMGTVADGTTDPSVGEHWYNDGTWVEIQAYAPSAVDGERYIWNGWTGTPDDDDGGCYGYYGCGCGGCGGGCGDDCEGYTGTGDGTTHSAWIKMECPITETASWDHEYRLTMGSYVTDATGTFAGGTTDPSVGEHWFLAGTDLDISAFAPALSYLDGERYTFDGWAGTGCGRYTGFDETHGINMDSPITETATWLHEYRLTMEANYGTTTPSLGEHWFLANLNVPINAISPVPSGSYIWDGWNGTGCGSYAGPDNPSAVDMFSPITQTAYWLNMPQGAGSNVEAEQTGLVIVIDVEGNIQRYPVTADGALLVEVVQDSPDGNLSLSIPVGTVVLNPDGTPAYLNPDPDVIGIVAGTVASAGSATIIQAYDLTPTGLYFVNGQATLTAKYDASALPAGKSLSWAYYDTGTGSWVDVETSGAVAAGGEPTAACTTSSLTVFALLAK